MGQKTHPVGFRLGITKTWDANWYADKEFAGKLQEDLMVRNYVRNRLKKAGISRIQIDRTPKRAVITIHLPSRHCHWQEWKRDRPAGGRAEEGHLEGGQDSDP